MTQIVRRAIEDQPALVDQENAVGDEVHFLQDVGGEQDGPGLPEQPDILAEVPDLVGIEPGGRFVHDEHVGVVEQGLRQADPLLVAPGQLVDGLFERFVEAAPVDDVIQALGQPKPIETTGLAEEPQEFQRRHVLVQRTVLREYPRRLDMERRSRLTSSPAMAAVPALAPR